MIRIELDEPTLARTRIAISPLWETINSLYLLRRNPGELPWPYTGWGRHARQVLAEIPQTDPVRLFFRTDSLSPDFLSRVPATANPTIAEELAILRATPAEVVAEQLPSYYPDDLDTL